MRKIYLSFFIATKNNNACGYFVQNSVTKCFITIAFILSFTAAAVASSYTVFTDVNASTLSARTEDTLYIDAVVTINTNETWNFTVVIMRAPNGTIFWANNSNLVLPACLIFNIQTAPTAAPGLLPTGGNASKVLIIAGVKVAVANDNSNNATFSFDEFTYLGGLPKFTITSNSPVCNGDALSLTATPDRSSSTFTYNYNWTISPVSGTFNPASSSSTTSATTTISPSPGSYTVTCTITATGDPLATATANVIVNALPNSPTSVIASLTAICSGSSSDLNATSTGNTIQWYTVTTDGTSIGTSASGTNFSVTPASTTTYYAGTLSSPGCKSSTRTAVTLAVNALPTAYPVTGGGSYCSDGSGVVIGLPGSQPGVNYQLYNGSSIVGSAVAGTGSAISFGNQTVGGTYTVTAINATTNCANSMTGSALVTINSRPTSVVGPSPQSICNGASATINVALTGTAPWSLTYFDGTTSTTVNNITVSPYSFNVSPGSSKIYTITALNDANCTSISGDRTGNASITVNPRPTGGLSGSTTICKGGSANLNLAVTGTGTVTGILSDGTAFSGTAPNISIPLSAITTTTYSVATLTNGTCSSASDDLSGTPTVTVTDLVIISITDQPSTAIFCAGSNATFSVAASGDAALTYQWQLSTNGITYTNISGAPYSGTSTNTLNVIAAPAALHGNYYRVIVNSSSQCGVPAISNGVRLLLTNYWTGLTSNDWNTATNWSGNTVPTLSCADIYIPGGVPYQPALSTGATTINNIIIQPGGVLTINGTLKIAGTITNAGIFDVINGAIEFKGSTDQSIPANAFYNNTVKDLIISNNVSLQGPASLTGTLSFGGTGKTFTTNDNLTLKSSAANTAVVAEVINGNSIAGDVTVERYIPAKRAWYHLSIPTHTFQSVKQAWKEGALRSEDNFVSGYGTQVTDNTPTWAEDGFDYYSPDGPSVKKYNPVTKAYVGIPNTSVNIASKEGWMTFVRGDRTAIGLGAISTPTILRTKGALHTGTQPVIPIPAGQFSSIGNPYASPLDMRKISKSGIANTFYLWDPNLGGLGAFQTFSLSSDGNYKPTPGGGSYPSSQTPFNYIQSGLAFFVVADPLPSSNRSITLTEAAKASSTAGSILIFKSTKASEAQLRTNIYAVEDSTGLSLVDGTLNVFGNNYSNALDKSDVLKISNIAENFSLKTDNQLLVIEKRNTIKRGDTIHLNMQNMKVKSYRLEFIGQDFDPGLTAFLEDNYYHTRIPLNINGTSTYNFKVVNIAGSRNQDRFRIVFKSGASMQVPITNSAVVTDHERPQIIVYPNPVRDGNINLQLINQPKGKYALKVVNNLGHVMMVKQIEHNEGSSTETIQLNKTAAKGSYPLEIVTPDNKKITSRLLIR